MNWLKNIIIALFGVTEATSNTELLIAALPKKIIDAIKEKILSFKYNFSLNGAQKQKLVVKYIEDILLQKIPHSSNAGKILKALLPERKKALLNAVVAVLYERVQVNYGPNN